MEIIEIVEHTLTVTAFVAVMMLAIEYVNIYVKGNWVNRLSEGRFRQYLFGIILGAIPGCLGTFVVVALYGNKRVTLGTLVATLIVSSGDESFVMLAEIPKVMVLMTLGLAALGMLAAFVTDRFLSHGPGAHSCQGFEIHEEEENCGCFDFQQIKSHWRSPSPHRAILTVALGIYLLSLASGQIGPPFLNWQWFTLVVISAFGIFVVVTVPDHFLDEHLWGHVARKHVPRIFIWTLLAIALIHGLTHFVDTKQLIADNPWVILLVAALLGLIPESGPHLVFVMLFSAGSLPLSVLVASSAVQDGHGALPLLAFSRSDFLRVKLINLGFGLTAGAVLMAFGF